MAKKGSLIVISGFSGVGKGTVVKKMVASMVTACRFLRRHVHRGKAK